MKKKNDYTKIYSSPFSRSFWKDAVFQLSDPKMLIIAGLMVALRVAIKTAAIPVGENLSISLGFLVNALGAMVFGPVVALIGGAASDTISCLLFPTGTYFFPFIFVEMLGSFLYGLFLWRQKFSVGRVIGSKFAATLFCNILLNPVIMIWYYDFLNNGKTYRFVTVPRLVKSLALFPAESLLLTIFLTAMVPVLKRLKFISPEQEKPVISKKHYILIAVLTVIAVAIVLCYYFLYLPTTGK